MVNKKQPNTYTSILKSTGIFGSSHIFSMVMGIITTKVIAMLLGPNGIGQIGLIKNSINFIASISNFGLPITSVKEIASPTAQENKKKLYESISVIIRFSIIIGILGSIISIVFSPLLSQWIFEDHQHWMWFILLAINFPLLSYNIALTAILQGLRKTKLIVYSGITIAVITMIVVIPCYFFLKENGIIPAIVLSNIVTAIINYYFTKPFLKNRIQLNFSTFLKKVTPIAKLGLLLSINVIFGYITHLGIKLYLKNYGLSSSTLGFYETGNQILITYFGIIFNAMTIDFYPKLSAIQHKNTVLKKTVNHQIEVALLLITPLIILMYSFSKIILKLLYSSSFENVDFIFKFGLLAVIIKAISWPIGYILLVKDDRKPYFRINLLSDLFLLLSSIFLYQKLKLTGIGLSMFFNYLIFGLYTIWYTKKVHQYTIAAKTKQIISITLLLGTLSLITSIYLKTTIQLLINLSLLIISVIYSWKEISSHTNLIDFFKKKRNH